MREVLASSCPRLWARVRAFADRLINSRQGVVRGRSSSRSRRSTTAARWGARTLWTLCATGRGPRDRRGAAAPRCTRRSLATGGRERASAARRPLHGEVQAQRSRLVLFDDALSTLPHAHPAHAALLGAARRRRRLRPAVAHAARAYVQRHRQSRSRRVQHANLLEDWKPLCMHAGARARARIHLHRQGDQGRVLPRVHQHLPQHGRDPQPLRRSSSTRSRGSRPRLRGAMPGRSRRRRPSPSSSSGSAPTSTSSSASPHRRLNQRARQFPGLTNGAPSTGTCRGPRRSSTWRHLGELEAGWAAETKQRPTSTWATHTRSRRIDLYRAVPAQVYVTPSSSFLSVPRRVRQEARRSPSSRVDQLGLEKLAQARRTST